MHDDNVIQGKTMIPIIEYGSRVHYLDPDDIDDTVYVEDEFGNLTPEETN